MSQNDLQKYDLYSPTFKKNAYATYSQMRDESPIMLHQGLQSPIWFVTGYEEAKQVLGDNKRFVNDYRSTLTPKQLAELEPTPDTLTLFDRNLLGVDKPDHTRLRGIVSKAFTNKRVQMLAPRIQEIADELLNAMEGQDVVDLIDAFAFPLPIVVICELLGVPAGDRDKFRLWSNAFIEIGNDQENFMQMMIDFMEYLGRTIAERRQNPQDDLISALIQAEEEGDRLNEQELYSMIVLLIIAGHETTVNLIANGMLTLFKHPEQLQQLQAEPSLIDSAIEEFLRYDGAVERATARFAAEDVEIGGQLIKRSMPVIVIVGAANRDPRQFANADAFDMRRKQNNHLDFGYGIHYCLGAPLARLEGRIAIQSLLARFPNIELAVPVDELTYRTSPIVRGVQTLPVAPNG